MALDGQLAFDLQLEAWGEVVGARFTPVRLPFAEMNMFYVPLLVLKGTIYWIYV